jgi:hypothetical protein
MWIFTFSGMGSFIFLTVANLQDGGQVVFVTGLIAAEDLYVAVPRF